MSKNNKKNRKRDIPGIDKPQNFSSPKEIEKVDNEKTKGKFRKSAHLVDQTLKYIYPKDGQHNLFEGMSEKTIQEIKFEERDEKLIVEGIHLTSAEQKVVDGLCKLFHESSQNINKDKIDYYTGNRGVEMIAYFDTNHNNTAIAPKMAFSIYKLTQEYTGKKNVKASAYDQVKRIIDDLGEKKFFLKYIETTKKSNGHTIERKIATELKLITIIKETETEKNQNNVVIKEKTEKLIILNPIFRHQIQNKFILYPNDINKRTIEAYGSPKVTEITYKLRDYLLRELSSKHFNPEIYLDRLYYQLAQKWMEESRKKKVKDYTDRAINICIKLGLLVDYKITEGKTGEKKIIFSLNKNFI